AHSAQIEIVVPDIAGAALHPYQSALERSDCAYRPDTDQARVSLIVPGAFDLHRQSKHLQKQDSHQDDQVAVTAKHGFHKSSRQLPVVSCQLLIARLAIGNWFSLFD